MCEILIKMSNGLFNEFPQMSLMDHTLTLHIWMMASSNMPSQNIETVPIHTCLAKIRSGPVLLLRESRPLAGPVSKSETCRQDNNTKPFNNSLLDCTLLSMFYQLLGGVQFHPSEIIGREEEEEVVHARKSLPLLTYRCKFTINGIPQDTLEEWMRTTDVLFNTIIFHKFFLP